MMNINLKMPAGFGYGAAETAARGAAMKDLGKDLALMAWYDRMKGVGAPGEACSRENWKCVRDYAEHHDAGLRVAVNGDEYEFFFSKVPAGTAELDTEGVTESHAGIGRDEFDNVQGG